MNVGFIGMIQSREQSEIHPPDPNGSVIDRNCVHAFAQAHEQTGFDRILVSCHSTGSSVTLTISYAVVLTKRIHFMPVHRPGFTSPTLAVRQITTLDQFTGGRLGVHLISGGPDSEQHRDGNYLDYNQRCTRIAEYLGIPRRIWTEPKPPDHESASYRFEQNFSEVKPAQKPHASVHFGGASDATVEVTGKHADVYVLWDESLDQVRGPAVRMRAEAAKHRRSIWFSVSFRPVLAEAEGAARTRTEGILERTHVLRVQQGYSRGGPQQNKGAHRLPAAAEQGEHVNRCLWMAIAKETGRRSNSTVPVGTPGQVADTLLNCYDLGVTTFLICGSDPSESVVDYGRTSISHVCELVARRDAQRKTA